MRDRLNKLHNDEKLSWRQIAKLPQFDGIVAAGSLCSFAKGTWEPKRKAIRQALELPVYETVKVVRDRAGRTITIYLNGEANDQI